MQRYIEQLIEDLEEAAENPPVPSYIETPPHLEELPDIAELALVPFKPISELTGIATINFPEMDRITYKQAEMVNKAIFKLFNSMNIELIDVPDGIPPEILYDVLINSWDEYVQYLPSSGMDLELCTGDWLSCPYGEFCNCSDDDYDDLSEDDLPPDRNKQSNDDSELPF